MTKEELLNPNSDIYKQNPLWKRPDETIEQYLLRTKTFSSGGSSNQGNKENVQNIDISSGSMFDAVSQQLLSGMTSQQEALKGLYSGFENYVSEQQRSILEAQQALRAQIAAQFEQRRQEIEQQRQGTFGELEAKMAQMRPYGGLSTALEQQKASIHREYDKAINQLEQLKNEAIAKVDIEAINQISSLQRDLLQKKFELVQNIYNLQNQTLQTMVNLAIGKENIETQRFQREKLKEEIEINRLKENLNSIISPLEKVDINKDTQISSSVKEIVNRLSSIMGVDPDAYYESIRKSILNPEASQIIQYSNPNTGESGFYRLTKRGTIIDKIVISPPVIGSNDSTGSNIEAIDRIVDYYISGKVNKPKIDEKLLADFNKIYGTNIKPEDILLSDEELKKKILSQISGLPSETIGVEEKSNLNPLERYLLTNVSPAIGLSLRSDRKSASGRSVDEIVGAVRMNFPIEPQTLRMLSYDEAAGIYSQILNKFSLDDLKETQLNIILSKILTYVDGSTEPKTALGQYIKKKHVGGTLYGLGLPFIPPQTQTQK